MTRQSIHLRKTFLPRRWMRGSSPRMTDGMAVNSVRQCACGNDSTANGKPPMLQWLAQFLTAPIINGFLDAYKAKLAAANAQGAQAVEVARAALLAEIEARKSANAVILAEQGRWYTAIIRPLLAAPVVIYLWKVIVWDIVLNLGTTDPIGGDVAEWAGWIVTAYVGGRSLEKIARTIWRRP